MEQLKKINTGDFQARYSMLAFNMQVSKNVYMSVYEDKGSSNLSLVFVQKDFLLYHCMGFASGCYNVTVDRRSIKLINDGIGDRKNGFTVAVFQGVLTNVNLNQYNPSSISYPGNKEYTVRIWKDGKQTPLAFYEDFPKH